MNDKNVYRNSRQLIGIQYLRAVAVILVVLDHTTGMAQLPKYFGPGFTVFNNLFRAGAVGVDLFFVISGFIILYVSLEDETLKPKLSFSKFLRHRFVRIIPFLWVCIVSTIILRLLGRGTFPVWDYLRSLTLFPVGEVEPRLIWTLRNEFLFYILFGSFIIYGKGKWQWLIIWFISPLFWFGLNLQRFTDNGNLKEIAYFMFNVHNLSFAFGVGLAYIHKKRLFKFQFKTGFGFLIALLMSIPLLLLASQLSMENASVTLLQVVGCGLLSALLVQIGIFMHTENKISLADKLGVTIGNASYAIYLTHSAVMSAILGLLAKFEGKIPPVSVFLIVSVAALCFGVASYFVIEKPLIRIIKKKFPEKNDKNLFVDDDK